MGTHDDNNHKSISTDADSPTSGTMETRQKGQKNMGVDHSAFVAYGAKVKLKDDAYIDDLDSWLGKHGKDLELAYVEWGSRCYGGDGGFIIGDKRSTRSIDFDDGIGRLPIVNPPTDTLHRIETTITRGAPFVLDGVGVAWWVGGHTW